MPAQALACKSGTARHLRRGAPGLRVLTRPRLLTSTLPLPALAPAAAVSALEGARASGAKVYVHCTAGLGRSPAVAIASLYWFTSMQASRLACRSGRASSGGACGRSQAGRQAASPGHLLARAP